jgi:predicted alpha/beta hydrolase family esterase
VLPRLGLLANCCYSWAEKRKIRGIVLVSAYHTDLGEPTEKEAEYFDRPWDFEAIRNNAGFIIQYSSPSDSLVPIAEQRYVAEQTWPFHSQQRL